MEKISATLKKDDLTDSTGRKWRIAFYHHKTDLRLVELSRLGKKTCGVFWGSEIKIYPIGEDIMLDPYTVYEVTYEGWVKNDDLIRL